MRATLSMLLLLGAYSIASAQQMINTTTPLNQISSSFFENNSVTWSLKGPNFFANFGGAAPPPFGNPDPNSGLRTGAAFNRGGISGTLGFNFGQGSNRTITSSAPSITTMDGVPGSFTSATIRPFVTGITPIVGDYPQLGPIPHGQEMSQAFQQRQQADFQRRAMKATQARQDKAQAYFDRGQKAEEDGNLKMARANYRLALATASGPLRVEVWKRMRANGWTR